MIPGCLEHLANLPVEGCGTTTGLVKHWHEEKQCYKYSRVGVLAANTGQDAQRGQFPHMVSFISGMQVLINSSIRQHVLALKITVLEW